LQGVGSGAGDVVGWDGPPSVAEHLDLDEAWVAGTAAKVEKPGHVDVSFPRHPSTGELSVDGQHPVGQLDREHVPARAVHQLGQSDIPPHVVGVHGDPDPWGGELLGEVDGLS